MLISEPQRLRSSHLMGTLMTVNEYCSRRSDHRQLTQGNRQRVRGLQLASSRISAQISCLY